jgi:predicted methyltransferase
VNGCAAPLPSFSSREPGAALPAPEQSVPADERTGGENALIVLSHYQVAPLLAARQEGRRTAVTSLDLGISAAEVEITLEFVAFPNGDTLDWECIREIQRSPLKCFAVEASSIREIRVFSRLTNWMRSLMPTAGAPTTLVSGTLMHRVKDTEPYRDTLSKVRTIAPLTGRVLDTATGLGYTAIEAAKTAARVITIELDPAALEIARQNPWSRGLFDNPKIQQVIGDTYDEVQAFAEGAFDRIIHDPPVFSLAGDLYSGAFYRELYRVLAPGGRLFHYIGDINSKSGARVTPGIIRRLQEAGFSRVARRPEAFGVTARR